MWTCGTARLYNGMGKGLYPEGYGPFLFDRKVPFRPNKNTIMRTRAKEKLHFSGIDCLTAKAFGAGVRKGAHFFNDCRFFCKNNPARGLTFLREGI